MFVLGVDCGAFGLGLFSWLLLWFVICFAVILVMAILFGRWVVGVLGGLSGLVVGGFGLGWFGDFAVLVVL